MSKQNEQENNISKHGTVNNLLIKISPNVFTVFIGLIASGYEYSYDKELTERIKAVKWDDSVADYFGEARTSYCDVYPFWPRAAMLVSASLNLDEKCGFGYSDFNKVNKSLDFYVNVDPKEKDEKTKHWLLQLPAYYCLIKNNEAFNDLWAEYSTRTESVVDQFMQAIVEAKYRVICRFKINESELPRIGVIPNILGFNGDFERIDGIVYVVCPKPDISCATHEYLHNIFLRGLQENIGKISEYTFLLNPIYESMFLYKYAWAMDDASWCRVFEENLVMAATIWVNGLNNEAAMNQSIKREKEGFAYVPVLLGQLSQNWRGTRRINEFIEGCLKACEQKYNSIISG